MQPILMNPISFYGVEITPDEPVSIKNCETPRGEPICSCGAMFLVWEV